MAESKQIQFVHGLCRKSANGNLRWASTGDENTFLAIFREYTVSIARYYDAARTPNGESYELRIVDAEGEEIDSFNSGEFAVDERDLAERSLRELYNVARRKAYGVDEIYEKLLDQIGAG